MGIYVINHRTANGGLASISVEGQNEYDAVERSRLGRAFIEGVRRDYVAEINAMLPQSRPDLQVQARVLAIFAAQVKSGKPPTQSFDGVVENTPALRKRLDEIKAIPRVSDKIKALNFEDQIQLLAEVGEASGTLGEVLASAAEDMIERNKARAEASKQMIPAFAIGIVGILIMLILPIFMVEPIEDLMMARGLSVPINTGTHIMLFIGRGMDSMFSWLVLIGGTAGLILTSQVWFPFVRTVPGLSSINDFVQLRAAYNFVSAFLPLYSRGVPLRQAMETLHRFSSGSVKKGYASMIDRMNRGENFGDMFNDGSWDPMMPQLMSGFGDMKMDAQLDLLKQAKGMIAVEMGKASGRISSFVSQVGMFTGLGITLVIFWGLTLPLLNVQTPMG